MIVSDAQQSDSAIQVHVSILPQTPLPSKLPYNIEQSTLCYTVRPGDGGLIIKLCPTLAAAWTVAHQAPCPWDSPGKNTGVGCHLLLQGIFLIQRSDTQMTPSLWQKMKRNWRVSWWKWKRRVKKLAWNSTFKKQRSWHPVPSLHGKQIRKKWK